MPGDCGVRAGWQSPLIRVIIAGADVRPDTKAGIKAGYFAVLMEELSILLIG